jgi:hypothetical protein
MINIAPGNAMTMATALHFATANGNARAVRSLLRTGADPQVADPRNSSNTPLHIAAQKGQTALVELLLDAGADPNVINRSNDTPLHAASANGHADVIAALLQGGAWFNVENTKGKVRCPFVPSAKRIDRSSIRLHQVPREVAGLAFSSSNRGGARKRVLASFKSYARYKTPESRAASVNTPPTVPVASQPTGRRGMISSVPPALAFWVARNSESLLETFEAFDSAGEGAVPLTALQRGLQSLGLSDEEMLQVNFERNVVSVVRSVPKASLFTLAAACVGS